MAVIDLRGTVHGTPNGALSLALEGELDLASEHLVTSWMSAFPAETTYLVDLSGVTFIDSHGLAALLKAQQLAQASNATLVLRSPNKQALDLLKLTNLDSHFTLA
jgi:anti-sigma B factor antagonist